MTNLRNENHLIISVDSGKSSQNSTPIYDKNWTLERTSYVILNNLLTFFVPLSFNLEVRHENKSYRIVINVKLHGT